MFRTKPRGGAIARVPLAAALVALSRAAAPFASGQSTSGQSTSIPSNVGQLGRFTITKTDAPPDILAQGRAQQQAALLTEAVLEQSNIKEVRAYREFLRKSARLDKAAQLKAVNDYVALHVRATADANLYQASDVWAPPINTLTIGGDCEDIALLKYWGLRRIGFPTQDMFLVVGVSTNVDPPEGHAVLVARLSEADFQVLDNTEPRVLPLEDVKSFEPAYAINTFGYWKVDDPNFSYGDIWRRAFKSAADRHAR